MRERIQIDGRMISKDEFAADHDRDTSPWRTDWAGPRLGEMTEFEVKTLAAFLYFAQATRGFRRYRGRDGRRLDCTNVIEPLVAVITNVSLDHTDRLGDTVEKIAFEKAGIIKTGAMVITATDDEDAWRVILGRAREAGRGGLAGDGILVQKDGQPIGGRAYQIHQQMGPFLGAHGGEFHMQNLKPGLLGKFQHVNGSHGGRGDCGAQEV